ncbi:MAG: collagen-like protein, partial [Bacteroidota bacterium]
MRLKHISYILSALLFLSTLACSDGEDGAQGEIGPVGMQGQQGNDGNPGAVGADGQNAAGFNQLTQYGAITLTLEGTRADNVPFTDESTFKFAPVGGNAIGFTNDVIFIDQGDDTTTRFLIARFLSTPDEEFQETWIEMDFQVVNLGEENEEVQALAILTITDYAVVGEDNKFFVM